MQKNHRLSAWGVLGSTTDGLYFSLLTLCFQEATDYFNPCPQESCGVRTNICDFLQTRQGKTVVSQFGENRCGDSRPRLSGRAKLDILFVVSANLRHYR